MELRTAVTFGGTADCEKHTAAEHTNRMNARGILELRMNKPEYSELSLVVSSDRATRLKTMSSKSAFLAMGVVAAVLTFDGCIGSTESPSQRHADANTPAGKVGKAAHAVAVQTGKVASAAGRQLEKAAHQAHEGWQEAARNDKAKNRK